MAGNRITDNLLRRLQLRVCIGHALSQKRTAIETPHAFSESIGKWGCELIPEPLRLTILRTGAP